jgi:hypothetical protein
VTTRPLHSSQQRPSFTGCALWPHFINRRPQIEQVCVKAMSWRSLLGDLRLSWRSSLSAYHDSQSQSKESLLLARHGRAPAAAAPLPKIKLTGSQALNSPESGPVTSCLEWRNFQHSATPSTPAVEDEDDDEFEDDWKVHQRSVQFGNRSPTVKPGSRW